MEGRGTVDIGGIVVPSACLLYTSVMIRMEVSAAVDVEELGSADKASVKWILTGLLGLPSPLQGTTAISICEKLSGLNK